MQADEEERIEYTFTFEKGDQGFTQILTKLFKSSNYTMDSLLLTQINQLLQTKNIIQAQQISQLSLMLSVSMIPLIEYPAKKQAQQNSYTNIEQLHKVLLQSKRPTKRQTESVELIGWLSKIWDKMLHFSCYKNSLDLTVLYYFIGQFLLYPEDQQKRLLKLLLLSINKTKQFSDKALEIILYLLMFFGNSNEFKSFSNDTKIKLKMINVLYLSKLRAPTSSQIQYMRERLEEINEIYIHMLMDQFQRAEETGCFLNQQELIWDKLFSTLLSGYSKYDSLKQIILKIIIEMISFKLDLQTIKLLIRELQITNEESPLKKWKQIFHIMNIALKLNQTGREVLTFSSSKSYIKYQLPNPNLFTLQIEIKTSSRVIDQQKMLFMLQDKNKIQQIWVLMRSLSHYEVVLIMLKVQNSIITEKVKLQVQWNPNSPNQLTLQAENNQITLIHNFINVKMPFNKINFANFIVGDEDGNLGTSIKNLCSLSISNGKKDNGVCYKMETGKNLFRAVKRKTLPAFVDIMRVVGDLDIFLMIISHAFKKLKKHPEIVGMVREAINLLEKLVQTKKIKHNTKVTPIEREKRLNAILCLCWQCSHMTYNALAVLQLLRFLTIRGVSNPDDQLEILCNFVFWKQFEWEYQKIIVMKIKELFSEMRIRQNNHKFIKKYCQRILEETALYYREEEYVSNGLQNKDNVLRIRYEFIDLVKQQLFYLLSDKKSIQDYYDFIEFILKMMFWTLSRRTSMIEAFDLTFSIELSFFARQLAERLKQWLTKQQKLLKIIKGIFDIVSVYQQQEPFYENKKIKLYTESRGFLFCEDRIIKQNLYFLAYSLIVLKEKILYSVIESDEKGFHQINCVVWQKKIIDPLALSIDRSCFYKLTTAQQAQIKYMFNRLSFKSLSYQQTKLLLTIYINNQAFFQQVDLRLSEHFCKVVNIKDLIDTCLKSISKSQKDRMSESEKESQRDRKEKEKEKKRESVIVEEGALDIKCHKIICFLGISQELTFQEGYMVLSELLTLYNPKQGKLNFIFQHYILKGLVQKSHYILQNHQLSATFIASLSQIEAEDQKIQKYIEDRGILINCLEYYENLITVEDISVFQGTSSNEEAQCHLQNYRINITGIMNSVASTEVAQICKLKNYYYFLQKQLVPLSKYFFEQFQIKPKIKKQERKFSKGKEELELPKYDLKEESKKMYFNFLDQRNLNLLKVEKVWLQVQQKNKSFWSTFIGKEYDYTLYQGTGSLNERYLLKKDTKKPKLQLPKMLTKNSSVYRNTSIASEMFQFNSNFESTSSIFDDAHLYRKQPVSSQVVTNYQEHSKQKYKSNKFRVLLITSSKIYQGIITITGQKLAFKQNQQINFTLYDKIFATECERRLQDQCVKDNYSFQQELTNKGTAIVKRYLFHDIAVQIHTRNRSLFILFNKKDHRTAFLYMIEKYIKVINREKLAEEAKILCEKWQNGLISNYHYLMKLNDLNGRSFNDLSQYYVFPWTIINFEDQIDAKFFFNKENFRDLSLPVGKLDKKKWQEIRKKYELKKSMRTAQLNIPNFLYGSFYSNRAIVCNFLIRISPFSSQHFQLQSQQFDAADRLFYSILDSYQSLTKSSSDFKELIPQFYYFPEFLKNRCAYNLGHRQNKDIVHNVTLPKWASCQYQFIFRMRKILQSEMVTVTLHNWIDLIFGVYANKKYALKADNLFLQQLYIEGYQKYLCQKDKISIQFFKQFGQVPIPIFTHNHTQNKYKNNLLDSILHPSMRVEEVVPQKINDIGKITQIYFYKRFTFLVFEKQIRMYQQQKLDKDFVCINGDFEGGQIKVWSMTDTEDKKHYCLIVHKKKTMEVLGYEIKKNLFNNYSIQGGDVFPFKHKCNFITIYEEYIFCAEDKYIYIYKNIKQQIDQEYSTKNFSLICPINKNKYLLSIFAQFTQHKSRILFMSANERGLIVSIDEENKCFLTQISSSRINIFNFFQIRNTYFQQRIVQMHLHNMGFILLRTNYDRILLYSFMGDNIVTKHLNFQMKANSSTEKPLNMAIWNHQLSQVVKNEQFQIIGTNLGNLWKIDLFELRKLDSIKDSGGVWIQKLYLNKSGFRKEGLLKLGINRIGRHSFTIIYAQNNKVYTIKSLKWQQAKKVEILGKKVASFW